MGEVFLAFRSATPVPLSEVRSTIIIAGIQLLRGRGLYPRYLDNLAHSEREKIVSLVAGVWIPVDLAVEHYRAAEALGLDRATVEEIGGEVAERSYNNAIPGILGGDRSRPEALAPWTLLSRAHRNNDLNWKGSDVVVYKEGPRQALYEWTGQPCAAVPYFVRSFGGFMRALLSTSCERAVYRTIPERCTPTTLSIRLSWV